MVLGRVLRAHGLNGALKIESYTSPGEHLYQYNPWWLWMDERWVRAWPCSLQADGRGGFLAQLAGLADRTRAQALAGSHVAVPRERLPVTGAGAYYWCDLVGLTVYEQSSGACLGRVSALLDNGAHEVLELESGELVPFVPGVYVDEVDLEGGRIHVRWPEKA